MLETNETKENWSWLKLLKGPFDGKNYAKALVLGLCMAVLLTIGYCVYKVASSFFAKPATAGSSRVSGDSTITTGGGSVTQNEFQSAKTETVSVTHMPLSGPLINFGSNEKKRVASE